MKNGTEQVLPTTNINLCENNIRLQDARKMAACNSVVVTLITCKHEYWDITVEQNLSSPKALPP